MNESVMRQMEWERIKGSLNALLCSYNSCNYDQYTKMDAEVNRFISAVEDEGLNE